MAKRLLRSVYFDVEQLVKLKELSERTRVPQSVYIRDGLDIVLKMHSKKSPTKKNSSTIKQGKPTSLTLLKR